MFADPAQESMSVPKKNDDHFALEYETKQKLYFHEGFTATIDQFLRKIVQDKRGFLVNFQTLKTLNIIKFNGFPVITPY